MTTTPLNWREHMTEEERALVASLDGDIAFHRACDSDCTQQRETIRRRITSRVRWERVKAEREKGE